MKAVALLFGTLALITISKSSSESNKNDQERMNSILTKCKNENQLDENAMEVIRKMEVPTSQEAKCLMGCVMRETGVIVNGKFDKGGALKLMENTNSDNKVDQDKVKAILDACEKQVENETDECNIAGKLAACVFDEAKKNRVTPAPQ